MTISAPTIQLPRNGSTWVDPLSPILLKKKEWQIDDDTPAASTQNQWIGTAATYSSGFTNIANLTDGNTATFATASDGGAVALLDPTVTFSGGIGAKYCTDVRIRLHLKKTWERGQPFCDAVRCHWYHAGTNTEMDVRGDEALGVIDHVATTGTDKASTEGAPSGMANYTATTHFFRAVLGKKFFTVQEVENTLPNCVLTIHVHNSELGAVTSWDIAAVGVVVAYQTADVQTAQWWQVSTDQTFADSSQTVLTTAWLSGTANEYTIPPGLLNDNTYYVRANAEGQTTSSGWSSTISFTVMPQKTARLFHNTVDLNVLAEFYPVLYIAPSAWTKTGGYTNVYQCTLARSSFWTHMAINDIWENGKQAAYTKVYLGYDTGSGIVKAAAGALTQIDAGAGRLFWDDDAGVFYVHCTGSVPPSSFHQRHSTRGQGFGIQLKYFASNRVVEGAADDREPYIPRILRMGDITTTLELWPGFKRSEGNATIVLANHDGEFYKYLYPGEDLYMGHNTLVWQNAKTLIKAVGNTQDGEIDPTNAPTFLTGYVDLDNSSVDDEEATFSIIPRLEFPYVKVPKLSYTRELYPIVPSPDQSTPLAEVFGTGHKRLHCVKCIWGPALATPVNDTIYLRVGREVRNVTALYKNNEVFPSGKWSFSAATQLITVTNPGQGWYYSAEWTCDCDGQYADGGASTIVESGDIAKQLFTGAYFGNLPTTDIDTTSFSLMGDGTADDVYPGNLRFVIDTETALNQVIQQLMFSSRAFFYEHLDGKIYAGLHLGNRDEYQQVPDQRTVTFFEQDIDADSWKQRIRSDTLIERPKVSSPKYAEAIETGDPQTTPRIDKWKELEIGYTLNEGVKQKYGPSRSVDLRCDKAAAAGQRVDDLPEWAGFLSRWRTRRQFVEASFRAYKKVWLVVAGDLIVVYRRNATTATRQKTLGAIGSGSQYNPALMLALEVRRSFDKPGGHIRAVHIADLTGWRSTWVPSLV